MYKSAKEVVQLGMSNSEDTYLIEFTHEEIKILHAALALMDGRTVWPRLLKKRIDHAFEVIS